MITFQCAPRQREVIRSISGEQFQIDTIQADPEVTISGLSHDGMHQLHYLVGKVLLLENVSAKPRPDGLYEYEFKLRVGRDISWHEEMLAAFTAEERKENRRCQNTE